MVLLAAGGEGHRANLARAPAQGKGTGARAENGKAARVIADSPSWTARAGRREGRPLRTFQVLP